MHQAITPIKENQMSEQKQIQDEFEQELIEALNAVEQGYITEQRMAIIRYACGVYVERNKTFNFDEILNTGAK